MTDAAEPLTIRIDVRLDVQTAASVVERLQLAARDREVVIEVAPRVECDPVALSFIAKAIEDRDVPVLVRGLSGHDRRILQYLGISFPSPPEPRRRG